MNSHRILVVLAILLVLSSAQSQSSPTVTQLPPPSQRTDQNIYSFVNQALKEKYWYYLTKACLLYLTSVDQGNGNYMFLAIYRNLVGTFLAITTWTQGSSSFEVNTLVRLGNGDGNKYGANYNPVNVEPLKLRYSLGPNEILIQVSDCGDIKVNGETLNNNGQEGNGNSNLDGFLVAECREFSEFAKQKFWYYLRDSKVIYSSVGITSLRNYCLVTYLNIVGTFFVIGSRNENTNENVVNTFVRLGNGHQEDSGANYGPVNFDKVHLRLPNFIEV